MPGPRAAVLALAAFLVAGCAAPDGAPAGLPVDEDGDPLPSLHGFVVDAAIRPLQGATVRLLDGEESATTDADGRYELRRPTFAAEDVLVAASLDGFEPRTQQAQVSGLRSNRLDFRLDADADAVPHSVVLEHRGVLRCAVGARVAGQDLGAGCDPDRRDEEDKLPPWMWEVTPRPNVAGAVFEVGWEAMAPTTRSLRAWLVGPTVGGDGGDLVAEASGPSPLRLEVPEDAARAMPRWTSWRLHVALDDADGAGAGPQEQRYHAVATLFHVDPAPPGYTVGA